MQHARRGQEERRYLLSGNHGLKLYIFHDSLVFLSVFVCLWQSAEKGQDLHWLNVPVCFSLRETALREAC